MGEQIDKQLDFSQLGYQLDKKALMLVMRALVGKNVFLGLKNPHLVYEEYEERFYREIHDRLNSVKIPYKFICVEKSPFRVPGQLHSLLEHILGPQYVGAPLTFLFALLKTTGTKSIAECSKKLNCANVSIRQQTDVFVGAQRYMWKPRNLFDFGERLQTRERLTINVQESQSNANGRRKIRERQGMTVQELRKSQV